MNENLRKIQKLLDAAEGNLTTARNLMRQMLENKDAAPVDIGGKAKDLNVIDEGKIVEGVFNGENMVGADGKEYPVPANYASKSKLVEGDTLKLTIADDGSFVYKQIAPIERRKTIGTLAYSNNTYVVEADGKDYKVLPASVTYFKGQPGDQVTIIIPKEHDSGWAAVENIIKNSPLEGGGSEPEEIKEEQPEEPKEEAPEEEKSEAEAEETGIEIEYPKNEEKPKEDKKPKIKNIDPGTGAEEGIKELEI
jgi:hypothetical protein